MTSYPHGYTRGGDTVLRLVYNTSLIPTKYHNLFVYRSITSIFTGVPDLKIAYKEAIEKNRERLRGSRPNQELTKGHLNPSAINSFNEKFMDATYTFTNVVPQFAASNFYLTKFETKVENYAKDNCGKKDGTLYLLTGRSENGLVTSPAGIAVKDSTNVLPKPFPTDTFVQGTLTLVTPRSLWTAVCCIWQVPGEEKKRAESFAMMSNNQDKRSNVHQTEMSVRELEEFLTTPPDAKVNLFPGEEECRPPATQELSTLRRECR